MDEWITQQPKVRLASKFERQVDRRTFVDKKGLYDGVSVQPLTHNKAKTKQKKNKKKTKQTKPKQNTNQRNQKSLWSNRATRAAAAAAAAEVEVATTSKTNAFDLDCLITNDWPRLSNR